MLSKGLDIDIATGAPRIDPGEREEYRDQKEVKRLEEALAFLGATQTDAGERIVAVIRGRLQQRIEELITTDPVASMLQGLMADLGRKESAAKRAMVMMQRRFFKGDRPNANQAPDGPELERD